MVLDKIVKNKKREVFFHKKDRPLSKFKSKLKNSNRNFAKAISDDGINLIAEVKIASPSEGIIANRIYPGRIGKEYEKAGAAAISVLTERNFFAGCLDFIKIIRRATKIPILRKDFIIDEYQVYESRFFGADAILLIARILSENQLKKFIRLAEKYRMDCLVEVHDDKELKKALRAKAKIIGINNRNLKTLKINLNNTLKLSKEIPEDKIIVSESGFKKRSDINSMKGIVNAILIGTTLMKAKDKKKKIVQLIK